ncbi:helix-turn-helix domain-containing protein [Streptomyces sp. NPDC004296]|uniref:helix-turn-helix domain-containing protein n=1 Tax=Streptomyces sp. NPDC004296 TaxID=3364697 RepID=UPI00368B2EC7
MSGAERTFGEGSTAQALRRELGAFLRSRRERLSPTELGLPVTPRRRTPGLRRGEVAERAGISASWYAWLEQGRVRTSEQVLRSVARALHLNAADTAHVLSFVEGRTQQQQPPGWVSPNLLTLVESVAPNPAVVIDPHWDLLAWNTGYAALLTDPARLPPRQRNLPWLVFRWAPARDLIVNWECEARYLLGQFRAYAARHPHDRRYAEIIADITQDPHAAHWYSQRETAIYQPAVRHFRHSTAGDLHLRYIKLAALDQPDHHFLCYLPNDPDTQAALHHLTAHAQTANPLHTKHE